MSFERGNKIQMIKCTRQFMHMLYKLGIKSARSCTGLVICKEFAQRHYKPPRNILTGMLRRN